MKIKKNIHQYLERHAAEMSKVEEFAMFIEEFFENVDEEHKEIAMIFKEELDDFVYEIDEEMAIFIVENLKKRDGILSGMKWTREEVSVVAKQMK
jgi:cysteine synthase